MASPPAVVIVVRHGARLDAADKQWHLKSPTPYDPPLTYGGWTQCRNLGKRIAALLQTREQIFNAVAEQEEADSRNGGGARNSKTGRSRRKKHRVIIHTSPFLRCVQTGIAISSGMSQYSGLNGMSKFERGPPASRSRGETSQERPLRPLSTINDEDGDLSRGRTKPPSGSNTRVKLRVDAFLGEWLSPEYFEHITAPPSSVLMLASAKAELLHRGEPISAEERSPRVPVRKNSSAGLWGSPASTPTDASNNDIAIEDGLELDGPAQTKPRNRATSHSGDDREPTSPRRSIRGSFSRKNGYHPPTPLYAISPQDPIPPGYVAHARDHCVDVDISWDSMRYPQNWGDGGKYGEEWSAMHKRFRHGLDSMVNWYRHHVESSHQRHGHLRTLHPPTPDEDEDEDTDTDTVVLLVSHGAGCNALIGALTNQPVLLDIGMASLTMAVRRERPLSPPPLSSSSGRRPSPSAEAQLSQEYEVALTASTDHLRGSAASSQNSSPVDLAHPASLKSLAPGLLQRSNTLPLRPLNAPPPPRHISPAPSKTRSTSLSKTSFASSPLNPNSPGATPPMPAKTWMEVHQNPLPPAKSWMEKHSAAEAVKVTIDTTVGNAEGSGGWQKPSKPEAASGLWQAKATASGPGLWSRPPSIPLSGPGSAAVSSPKPRTDPVVNKAAFVSPGAPTAEDHRLEQWMVDQDQQRNGTYKAGATRDGSKSVHFAEPPQKTKDEDDVSTQSRESAVTDGDNEHDDEHGEELSRWHDEVRAGEHAPRIYKTPSEIRMHELGMKRRWTMNDERNQEREKESDWRLEAWM